MANDPTDVGCGPEHVAGMAAINIFHCPLQRDRMAAVVADDTLGLAGRARGVEDVKRIGCCDWKTVVRLGRGHRLIPIQIAYSDKLGMLNGALMEVRLLALLYCVATS